MNKKIIFLFCWNANALLLLLLILIPKVSELYSILYLMTMFMMFVVPLVLIIVQDCFLLLKFKVRDEYDSISNVGCIMIILLTLVNFLGSIETVAIPQMITILLLFVFVELLLGFLKIAYKECSLKQYIWLEVATYAALLFCFVCMMIISVDFGKI